MQGWRTIIFNVAIAAVGALQASNLATVIPPHYAGVALIVIGAVGTILRSLTTTPVGQANQGGQ